MTAPPPLIETPLIEARALTKHFAMRRMFGAGGTVKAVEGVSFAIRAGETFALVGESGCGKSTTGRLLLRLIEPTGGQILYKGADLATLSPEVMRSRRRDMQIVFQDQIGRAHV